MHNNLPKAVDDIRIWFESEWDTYRKSNSEPLKDITVFFENKQQGISVNA